MRVAPLNGGASRLACSRCCVEVRGCYHRPPIREEPMAPSYTVEGYEILAETPELRMVMLTLARGQEVPWHWHSHEADRFFCLQGPMVIETRAPRQVFELGAGET